jgi:O-antigen/teichoic acid export membrane protein
MAYMNYGYVLIARTNLVLFSIVVAAAANLILNLVLIPRYGAWGAAVASLLGFGAGFVVAAVKMPRVFSFPLPDPPMLLAAALGLIVMTAWLIPFYHVTIWFSALYVIPVAIVLFLGGAFLVLQVTGRNPTKLLRGLWREGTGAGMVAPSG